MRADRLLSLLMMLQVHGRMTAAELAERLEVSPRTIYRDLDALSSAGVPVYTERGPGGGVSLLEQYRTRLTGLKEEEVRALFTLTVSGLLADLGAEEAAERARLKLQAALPAPFREDAQRVQERLLLDAAGWFRPPEPTPHLSLLQEAVWSSRRVRMRYRLREGAWVRRLVDPYGLVAKAGVWYMVGAMYGAIRVYRVSRMGDASLTESTFRRPEEFDLTAFWRQWCARFEDQMGRYEVTVRVPPGAETELVDAFGEGVYHLLNGSEPDEDGRVKLCLTFPSAEDAARELLGLGTAVEVVEPPNLRRRMARKATAVAEFYEE